MNQIGRPIANPIVVLRVEFDDWAVLFNPDTAAAVGINPVGVAVWRGMDGKSGIEEIVAEINRNFEEVSTDALEEISEFVSVLAEQGFVGFDLTDKHR
ncbi:MAG: PqqD family peptide modification chaperone [Burkholderiales bacterium]|jgi:SynChlorMet cassette protein ScmD